jgi:hypothetical protein
VVILLMLAAAASPSAHAVALGRQIAERGTLATLLPMIQQKETEELVIAHPELSAGERAKLRSTAQRVYQAGRDRLLQAEAQGWAGQLSVRELRAVLSFQNSAAGTRYRAAAPAVVATTMKAIGKMDFKDDVLAAYCRETGKLCSK